MRPQPTQRWIWIALVACGGIFAPLQSQLLHAQGAPSQHVLEATDLIEIKVFQEPELDTVLRVPADGKITLPLIGEISVIGKTVQQTAQIIRERLGARFLVDPQVTLTVSEPARRFFTVLGQVQRPGTYRFPDRQPLNLIQVIGIAGGYTRFAAPAKVIIKRKVNGREVVLRFNADRMARELSTSAASIESGDIVSVGERIF